MDIERGIVKALFYDYPIEKVVQILEKRKDFIKDDFIDILPELVRWRERSFTTTEATIMTQSIEDEHKGVWPLIHRPFDVLAQLMFSNPNKKLLTMDHDEPKVDFDSLFRWDDITLYLSEDLLVLPFVALHDLDHRKPKRELFLWDDILRHNNHHLNEELDNGLTDLHAHLNASTDIFLLNWVGLMNHLAQKDNFEKLNISQDIDLVTMLTGEKCNVRQLCMAAAYLRYVFYQLWMQPSKLLQTNQPTNIKRVLRWLKCDAAALCAMSDLQSQISASRFFALKTADKRCLDYCIVETKEVKDNKNNPNIIYQGERRLFYEFFYHYYAKDPVSQWMAPYFYLYILIRNRIRREFVQINSLKGFENFEKYQNSKDLLFAETSLPYLNLEKIAVQTSLHKEDYIEARISPKHLNEVLGKNYKDGLFTSHSAFASKQAVLPSPQDHCGIVAHFIKPSKAKAEKAIKKTTSRFEKERAQIHQQIDDLVNTYQKQLNRLHSDTPLSKNHPLFVGIDAAGSELFCRPEVYGHAFRYAKAKGLNGRTYHVGEDFFDLTDGLRAIDEAILFLDLGEGNRIGHALALGTDAESYYKNRHYTSKLSRQALLDDCVWTYMRAHDLNVSMSSNLQTDLIETALQMYNTIGYQTPWNIQHYWHSMLLRGNEPHFTLCPSRSKSVFASDWDRTDCVHDKRLEVTQNDKEAEKMYWEYHFSQKVKREGLKVETQIWDKEIAEVVKNLQTQLQWVVSRLQICVECCPTSNRKIGFMENYENHPLITKFYPIKYEGAYPLLHTTINTDDRGVFNTSLYKEYSLIALALKKQYDDNHHPKYTHLQINNYIASLQKEARTSKFKV